MSPSRLVALTQSAPIRVCIVTGEFVGPQPCGGIGTAMTGLAHALAEAGHSVTVLYTRGMWLTPSRRRAWGAAVATRGIELAFLTPADIGRIAGPLADVTFTVPSAVLDWLSTRRFDLVHFNEMEADGYLALAARRFEIAFPETTMAVGLHSPTAWVEDINREITAGPLSIVMTAAERLAMAAADWVWSPSGYLLDWLSAHDYPLPERVVTQQYVLPECRALSSGDQSRSPLTERVRSLVFFGRLEERKGLVIFLDALDVLADELARDGVEVVFLGKAVMVAGVPSGRLIAERAQSWRFAWRQVSSLNQPEAIAFLREPGRLAVMASPADNSPCTVYEAIQYDIPFIAARAGGVPELIHADDSAAVLFEPDVTALSERLRTALAHPPRMPRPARTAAERRDAWLASHDPVTGWPGSGSGRSGPSARPALSRGLVVVIEDIGDDAALGRSLSSLAGIARFDPVVIVLSERRLPSLLPGISSSRSGVLLSCLRSRRDEGAFDLLTVIAGIELVSDAIAAMIDRMALHEPVWLLPSVSLNGHRCDAPPVCVATALAWGANPLGVSMISADILLGELDGNDNALCGQPLGGLLDRALLAGARPQPYPTVVANAGERELRRSRPVITPERVRFFAAAAGRDLRDIVTVAATQGLKPALPARRAAYRLARSRLSWLTPYLIAAAERLRRWKR